MLLQRGQRRPSGPVLGVPWRFTAVIVGAALLVAAMGIAGISVLLRASPVTLEPATSAGGASAARHTVFSGVGAWVDVYDYAPDYQPAGAGPPVTTEDVETMATQASAPSTSRPPAAETGRHSRRWAPRRVHRRSASTRAERGGVVRPELHRPGTRLGAHHGRPQPLQHHRWVRWVRLGHRVEALDDVPLRSARLLSLSRQLRSTAGDLPIAAVVLPPVLLTDISPKWWPEFLWRGLAAHYDPWFPMAYRTVRASDSRFSDPTTYETENTEPHATPHRRRAGTRPRARRHRRRRVGRDRCGVRRRCARQRRHRCIAVRLRHHATQRGTDPARCRATGRNSRRRRRASGRRPVTIGGGRDRSGSRSRGSVESRPPVTHLTPHRRERTTTRPPRVSPSMPPADRRTNDGRDPGSRQLSPHPRPSPDRGQRRGRRSVRPGTRQHLDIQRRRRRSNAVTIAGKAGTTRAPDEDETERTWSARRRAVRP
jgi:hypothetical protein